MLDLFFSQQGISSFWLPLLAALIIFILQLLISNNKGTRDHKPMTFNQVTQNVQNIYVNQSSQNYKKRRNNKDDYRGAIGLLMVATIFYQSNEVLVLQVMTSLAVFVFTFWAMTIIHAYRQDVIHGKGWNNFLLATLIFICISLYTIYITQHPIFEAQAPNNPGFTQLSNLMELAYRVIGIGLVFSGLITILMTLVHYILRINLVRNDSLSTVTTWILRATQSFSSPVKIGIILLIIFSLAYAFASGYAYHIITER
jgi:hypothetical protein